MPICKYNREQDLCEMKNNMFWDDLDELSKKVCTQEAICGDKIRSVQNAEAMIAAEAAGEEEEEEVLWGGKRKNRKNRSRTAKRKASRSTKRKASRKVRKFRKTKSSRRH